jgi:transcriptional regulator with XRE-family HTH domain
MTGPNTPEPDLQRIIEAMAPDTFEDKIPTLRDFIHEQMRLRGWNYSEFAKAVGTDGSVVSRWIRDRCPSPEMTRQMAHALGVDEQYLMTLVGHISPQRTDVSPEQAALIAKLKQIPLNRDRFLILDALFEHMRQHEP